MKSKIARFFENENNVLVVILSLLFVLFLLILWQSEGYVGGADSLTHYRFSRYSWRFPEFLLHHWAKPLFTLLTSPFAQFGHGGVAIFNLLAGLTSGYLAWLSARKLGYNSKFLIPVVLFFMPIYSLFVVSGLTEILFGLNIILTTYLCLERKYLLAAIVISFSPMVRTEGIILIPVFGLFFLIMKQYKFIPWLITGSLIYSIVGYYYFDDFFWLITQMPYAEGAVDLYGKGRITYFVNVSPQIFGPVTSIMIALGISIIFIDLIRKRTKIIYDECLLVVLPFVMYFLAHSVMWWSGIGHSFGMHRYMIAIMPLGAIISIRAFNLIKDYIDKTNKTKTPGVFVIIIFTLFVVFQPFKTLPSFPHKIDDRERVKYNTSCYILENDLNRNKIYYYDPAFMYYIGFDPFDTEQAREFVPDPTDPQIGIDMNEIVIWDGEFSQIRQLSLDSLRASIYFNELASFEPSPPIIVWDSEYKVVVFQRNNIPYNEE
jgi:hypothetical protein